MRKWLLSLTIANFIGAVAIGLVWFIACHFQDGAFAWCLISMVGAMIGLTMIVHECLPERVKNGKE